MSVKVTGIGLFAGRGPGELKDFDARRHVPERKHLKIMTRGVRLGVAAVRAALEDRPGWDAVAPERRALFVGATPVGAEPSDLEPAFQASLVGDRVDVAAFGERGYPLVPPLWLVKGLSNNVLGYASAYFDLRGPNGTRCEGRGSGLAAIVDGVRAIEEGRADLVIAGGADSLVHAARLLDVPVGEGAAFLVLEREGADDAPVLARGGACFDPDAVVKASPWMGELGAATGPVWLAWRLLAGDRDFRVSVTDPSGIGAWIEVE